MKTALRVAFILALGSMPAWATLGQYEGSVSADQQHLRTEDRVQAFQAYKVHQLTTTNGVIVREYVSPKGMVFGIAWQAPFMPDMKQLLGDYTTTLQTATKEQTAIHHHRGLIVKTNDFVFVNSGHMRFFRGSAYVPSLIPSNVSAEVVK
ncbi:MAG: DUF2844 domain-containing protein [Terriglobia bacterium]